MKILNQVFLSNNIAFQKQLVAKARITNANGDPQNVNIYHLNEQQDAVCLKRAINSKDWKNSYYMNMVNMYFDDEYANSNFYAMEDDKKKMLCLGVLDERNSRYNNLTILETIPKQSSYSNKPRSLKYIGETMFAFFAKRTKQQGKHFCIPTVANRQKTKDFYFEHCRCKPYKEHSAVLKDDNINGIILLNEKHTKGKIHLIG